MIEQNWQVVETHDADKVESFAQELNSSHVLARVLLNRGIDAVEDARRYFIPKIEHLHDPFLMTGMTAAVERIGQALRDREKILVFGDYDVDGTTATSLLLLFFKGLGHPVDYYVPDRLSEGYGVSEKGIRFAHEKGAKLMITVDCGITAVSEIEVARESGLDVIVCDHHEPGPRLPRAVSVLNPKREDCSYPFKELAGVGVAFKLLHGLQQHMKLDEAPLFDLLYLVAIGSAADIVPLVDENRVFVRLGLRQLGQSTLNIGLRAMFDVTSLTGKDIGTGQIVFVIAPRINAAGRLGDAGRAIRLLTSDDEEFVKETAAILETENKSRREIDERMLREALELIYQKGDTGEESIFVLHSENWHPGVVGIVASRIVDKYFRPAILIATENGRGRGSARSVPGFDIHAALKQCDDLMLEFGGHKYAAGLSVETDNIPKLRERLSAVASELLTDDMKKPLLRIDSELAFRDIDAMLLKLLHKMAPFGPRNTRPTFLTRGVEIVGTPAIVGRNHLKFKVRQNGVVMDAIGFDLGDKKYRISSGERNVDLVYVVDENEYQGRKTIQLRVKDLR